MSEFMAEYIGTTLLLVLGQGVVANVLLNKTKGQNAGLLVITLGWAVAVFVGVYACSTLGGPGHLNPAFSIATAYLGKISWNTAGLYILAQLAGAITGSILIWLAYRLHYNETHDAETILATFSTGPAIKSTVDNLITEAIGTLVLVLGALLMTPASVKLGTLDALPVALLVLGIGVSLGGPTGYAINPARDLGPRIAHSLLPIKGKSGGNWPYAWIPVAGPVLGALLAALVYGQIHG